MPNFISGLWTARPPRLPALALSASVAALALITGCGGAGAGDDSGDKPGVASLDDPGDKQGKTGSADEKETASGSEEGVQLRLDSSQDEQRLVNNAYSACLKKNGVPTYSKTGNLEDPGHAWVYPETKSPAMRDAAEACKAKKPLLPPELMKEKNPHYMDDFREQIKCLNKRGVKVEGLPDGSGYNYDGSPPPNYVQIENECKLEAFSDKK
ncbi:hypothetical protein ACFZAE_16215 [Streptomyces scabiei]|uniref:hypothetical protein n=1 Tax=Streptomyces TaxID=1883 RepID=UPI001BFF5B8B|nr:hypothetical protein [Streptomyces sp. ATCC 21386]